MDDGGGESYTPLGSKQHEEEQSDPPLLSCHLLIT